MLIKELSLFQGIIENGISLDLSVALCAFCLCVHVHNNNIIMCVYNIVCVVCMFAGALCVEFTLCKHNTNGQLLFFFITHT